MFICHVCGYAELEEPPWGNDGKTASFNICDCCGVEYGYEDATENALLNYRNNWISSGAKWFDDSKKPSNWKVEEQLKNIKK